MNLEYSGIQLRQGSTRVAYNDSGSLLKEITLSAKCDDKTYAKLDKVDASGKEMEKESVAVLLIG